MEPRVLLTKMFEAAVAAAQPALRVPPLLPTPPAGRLVVIGAGKASAAMAKAVEDNWPGGLSGVVVTRYGYAVPCQRIEIIESAHPVPDAASERASERLLQAVAGLREDDVVLCLVSGLQRRRRGDAVRRIREWLLRLGKYFGVSPEIWLDLQSDYELRIAKRDVWPTAEPRVRTRAAA